MSKLTVSWAPDSPANPNLDHFEVNWISDGTPLAVVSVPFVAGQASYSSDFPNALTPTDVDSVTVDSADKLGQKSPQVPSVPPSFTIPNPPPPTGPTNVVLTFTP